MVMGVKYLTKAGCRNSEPRDSAFKPTHCPLDNRNVLSHGEFEKPRMVIAELGQVWLQPLLEARNQPVAVEALCFLYKLSLTKFKNGCQVFISHHSSKWSSA